MKLRQREKILKAFYGGRRLLWKGSTVREALRPFSRPSGPWGGFLIPKYISRHFDKLLTIPTESA